MVAARKWWSVKQVAEHYGLSPRTIYDAVGAGDLVAHRFGKARGGMRISDEERVKWEQQCRDMSPVPAPLPTMSKSRPVRSDLVAKHFGT